MLSITKIILNNFKRFRHLELVCNERLNIFVGDNESGKSTILQAIDLVSRGSLRRVEDIGLSNLFNAETISEFLAGDKDYTKLPIMSIELYFSEAHDINLNGNNNSEKRITDGIKLVCLPNEGEYGAYIRDILSSAEPAFPFEFYKIEFSTFSGQPYNGHTRKHNSIFIDNSQMGNPYALNEYVHTIYKSSTNEEERLQIKHQYHRLKVTFAEEVLSKYKPSVNEACKYIVRDTSTDNIETSISLQYSGVPIENKGKGQLCLIKTEVALQNVTDYIDAILMEEPENHLSYGKMLQLISHIQNSTKKQLFLTTHSDMIATRLGLRNCILLNNQNQNIAQLSSVPEDTANFFMKAPDNNMLQYILSSKSILVEGDAEYILMDKFTKCVTNKSLEELNISVIAVDGRCFKRYLEISKILPIKTVVLTDNDGDYSDNIQQTYAEYVNFQIPNIGIFADSNDNRRTFEVCMYEDNKGLCDELFSSPQRRLTIQEYMLRNKADAAFTLLTSGKDLNIPQYIHDALKWIVD